MYGIRQLKAGAIKSVQAFRLSLHTLDGVAGYRICRPRCLIKLLSHCIPLGLVSVQYLCKFLCETDEGESVRTGAECCRLSIVTTFADALDDRDLA